MLKNKLSRALYALVSVKNTINQKGLILLYNSIFHCHLLYAIQIWSCSCSSPVNEIYKVQKNAIRIIAGKPYNAHTEPLFKKLQIMPLPDLITFSKIQFIPHLTKLGLGMRFGTMERMKSNYVTVTTCKT